MKKTVEEWTIGKLEEQFYDIDFPEYQREPNLWNLTEKQRLIDSITRGFHIASLYFYKHSDGSIDCVDGRQRIGAIMSFLGVPSDDLHANFQFRTLNEIYSDIDTSLSRLYGKSFTEIKQLAENDNYQVAAQFVDGLMNYQLTIVLLSDSNMPSEFNLQFTRLNLGTIINAGEKLNAMIGEFPNECFEGIGQHAFLANTRIPTRRFAREQVAAQILAQVFSLEQNRVFTRTRHFDLQRVFKQHSTLNDAQQSLVDRVSDLLDLLNDAFEDVHLLRSRAITVSTVLLAWKRDIESADEAAQFADFIKELLFRLNWQVRKRLRADEEYYYLLEFRRHISQASAERSSVEARARLMDEEFSLWLESGELKGDANWKRQNPGRDPSKASRR